MHSRHQNSVKARIAAEYVGVKLEVVETKMGETNKTPEFLKLNPAGRVLLQLPSIDNFPHGTIAPDAQLMPYRSSMVHLKWADPSSWCEFRMIRIIRVGPVVMGLCT